MEKLLLCSLLLLLLGSLSHTASTDIDLDEDGSMAEQRAKGDCPEYCTCLRQATGDGAVVRCERITATQHFNDMATAFDVRSKHTGGRSDADQLTMDAGFFVHLQLKSVDAITVVDVVVTSIDVNAFQGLDSLSQVNMTNNNLQVLHPDTFAGNKELRRLSLSQNPLSFTQKSTTPYLLNIPNLRELDLSSCQLYNLLPTTFSKLSELTYLNLASNVLNFIDPRTFSTMTSLEEINLSDNKIQELHADLFRNNPDLDVLILNNNPIKTLDNLVLPSVTVLDLSFCRFTKLKTLQFDALKNLNLSGNALVDVDVNVFAKMARLTYLDLSNNNFVGQLDAKIFINNPEIATLSLRDNPKMQLLPTAGFEGDFRELYRFVASNCGLESLTPLAFNNMTNLAYLDLSHNAIASLEAGVLPRRLKHLSLAYNKITSLDSIQFPTESQLRQLMLQNNQIKMLKPGNFINLPYLTKLQLQSCGMEQIWSGLAEEMPYLKNLHFLNLANNKLQKISPADLVVFSELNTLGIMSNPLLCIDELATLIAFLQEHHVDPILTEDVSNLSEKFEWGDIWNLRCGNLKPLQQAPKKSEDPKKSEEVVRQEVTIASEYYDEYWEDNPSENSEDSKEEPSDHLSDTPKQLNMSATSYQLIVMAVVAIATFLLVIACFLIWKVCKQRLMRQRVLSRRQITRKSYGPIYKPLFDNEHVNTPTTPIMKTRIPFELDASSNGHNEEMDTATYSQTVGKVTYLNKPFKPVGTYRENQVSI